MNLYLGAPKNIDLDLFMDDDYFTNTSWSKPKKRIGGMTRYEIDSRWEQRIIA
jgi:hypothetical protein